MFLIISGFLLTDGCGTWTKKLGEKVLETKQIGEKM
jgi:hypothetical protein